MGVDKGLWDWWEIWDRGQRVRTLGRGEELAQMAQGLLGVVVGAEPAAVGLLLLHQLVEEGRAVAVVGGGLEEDGRGAVGVEAAGCQVGWVGWCGWVGGVLVSGMPTRPSPVVFRTCAFAGCV